MKHIIKLALDNTTTNYLFFFFLLIVAYFSYFNTPKEMFPPNALDKIIVQGEYTGASSTILDKLIVQDIEKILQENQNLEEINTLITNGTFHVNASIKNHTNKQKIVNNIKNKIETLKSDLPSDMDLPTVDTVESYFKLIDISIASKNHSINTVEIAKQLKEELKKLPNLYEVKLNGNYDLLLMMSLNQEKLNAYNISKSEAIQALSSHYTLYPAGSLQSQTQKFYVSTKNSNITPRHILNSHIKINNHILFIKDIVNLKYDYEKKETLTKTNGKASVILNIKKAQKGDALKLSKQIRNILTQYEKQYPTLTFKVLSDSSFWIKTRLNIISSNIFIGLLLLFIAIWVFVSFKIALVVMLGIPISFAFGFIGIDFFDSSLNTLSMIGVLLSLGILVDEAIVVSENIHRHQLLGKNVYQACIDGTSEVMPILFAALLTTIIAFLPLTMLSGGLGLFIKIIPLMVIILVISSFLESFLFLPIHYLHLSFIKENSLREKMWRKLALKYQSSLEFMLKKRKSWLIVFIFVPILGSYLLIKQSSFQLFPTFDAMSINITGKVKNNALEYTLEKTQAFEKRLLEVLDSNNVSSIATTIGMNSDGRSKHDRGENLFTFTLNLKQKIPDDFFNLYINPLFTPFEQSNNELRTRTLYAKQIQEKIEKLIKKENLAHEFESFAINIPQTGVVKNDIVISVASKDEKKIQTAIKQIKAHMKTLPHLYNIDDDMKYDEMKVELEINSYGKKLGFDQGFLVSKIQEFLIQKKLGKVVNDKLELIELKTNFNYTKSLKALKNLLIKTPNNKQQVRLFEIAILNLKQEITNIRKSDLEKIFTVTASINKKAYSSRKFYRNIRPLLKKLKQKDIKLLIKGEAKTNSQIQKDIAVSLLFALIGILLVLSWLFSSLFLCLFALSVIPLSLFGVLVGHTFLGINMTFSSLIGFVGLIGIVMNDTLIMLKFIKNTQTKTQLKKIASTRVRPILLTSITTVLGLSTLIFFASGESLLMQPLAISIGFGLLFATVINLYYLPLGYSLAKKYNHENSI